MGAVTHGMNVAEVRRLGDDLKVFAGDLDRIVSTVNGVVHRAGWAGGDADVFVGDWSAHRARLGALAEDLRGFGQCAINNAEDQERASGAAGESPSTWLRYGSWSNGTELVDWATHYGFETFRWGSHIETGWTLLRTGSTSVRFVPKIGPIWYLGMGVAGAELFGAVAGGDKVEVGKKVLGLGVAGASAYPPVAIASLGWDLDFLAAEYKGRYDRYGTLDLSEAQLSEWRSYRRRPEAWIQQFTDMRITNPFPAYHVYRDMRMYTQMFERRSF